MPVVDNSGAIVGMISEGDLVRWHEGFTERQARWLDMLAEGFDLAAAFLAGIQQQNRKVKSVMSPNVTTVTEDMPARDVASLMCAKNIKRVPVVRDGRLVGILARSDLIRALAQVLALGEKSAAIGVEKETLNEALRHRRKEDHGPDLGAMGPAISAGPRKA